MKPLALLTLLLAMVLSPAAAAGNDGGLDDAVASLTQAMIDDDASEVARWLSDDWVIIDGDGGVIGRARFLAVIASGALVHDAMAFDEVQVRRVGGARLWIARARGHGLYRGQRFTFDERSTSVWARRNGRWTCRLTQLTPIAGHRTPP